MRRSTWVLTVLLLAIVIVVMLRSWLSRQPPEPAVDSTSIVESAPHRLPSPSAKTVALPDELHTLEDRAFIDALPALERLANGGRQDALRVLFDKLGSCTEYRRQSDEEIRERAQERYAHQIEMNSAADVRYSPIKSALWSCCVTS